MIMGGGANPLNSKTATRQRPAVFNCLFLFSFAQCAPFLHNNRSGSMCFRRTLRQGKGTRFVMQCQARNCERPHRAPATLTSYAPQILHLRCSNLLNPNGSRFRNGMQNLSSCTLAPPKMGRCWVGWGKEAAPAACSSPLLQSTSSRTTAWVGRP